MSSPTSATSAVYFGLFQLEHAADGQPQLARHPQAPRTIPDPSGRLLRVATVEGRAQAICPACTISAKGGYVSFVQDLRLAYACPKCHQFVWLRGA